MKRRLSAVLPALVAVAASIPIALATTPASAAAACGTGAPDLDSSSWDRNANGANQRSGSSTGCAINGIAYNTHRLDYHCFTHAGDYTWTYLRNDTTGTYGWVRDDLLADYGSSFSCGF
jgi:hypothetical protein